MVLNMSGTEPVANHPEWASDFSDPHYYGGTYKYGTNLVDYTKVRAWANASGLGYCVSQFAPNSVTWGCNDRLNTGNFDLVERISAGYAMNTIDLSPRLRLVAGLRLENTSLNTLSYGSLIDPTSPNLGDLINTYVNQSYLNLMPSASLRISLDKDSGLRVVYGRGLGRPDGAKLRSLVKLHTAATDFTQRTMVIARGQGSNLLDHVRRALEQADTGKPVAGAPGAPGGRALFLVGHDTNLANIVALLSLSWIVDGRRDDTPPGGALIFELWRTRATGSYFMQTYYSAQTLEQMRSASSLTLNNPPQRVHLYLPGCSRQDLSCLWSSFSESLKQAADPRYIDPR